MQKSSFIFIGRSGSGKGTQANLLIEYLKNTVKEPVLYFEVGQKFRDFVKKDSYSAGLAKKIMDSASLQPDFLTIWIITQALIEDMAGDENIIIDGGPRSFEQAKVIDGALDFYDFDKKFVVYLDISPEETRSRLKERGRSDDTSDDMIDNRLSWFAEYIIPTIDYYKKNPSYNLITIDSTKSIPDVFEEIKSFYNQTKLGK